MQAFVESEAQCLIDGTMARYAIEANEFIGRDPYPEMRLTRCRRFRIMSGMLTAFIDNFEIRGCERIAESRFDFVFEGHAASAAKTFTKTRTFRFVNS
jgi:hypothetical protein